MNELKFASQIVCGCEHEQSCSCLVETLKLS